MLCYWSRQREKTERSEGRPPAERKTARQKKDMRRKKGGGKRRKEGRGEGKDNEATVGETFKHRSQADRCKYTDLLD